VDSPHPQMIFKKNCFQKASYKISPYFGSVIQGEEMILNKMISKLRLLFQMHNLPILSSSLDDKYLFIL